MDRQLEHAQEAAVELAGQHPALTFSEEMPSFQGCTNRILFAYLDGNPVVVKCFVTPERKRHEKKMLQALAPSGMVPRLYPLETESIVVMERLPGEALHARLAGLAEAEQHTIFRQIGGAFARVATSSTSYVGAETAVEPRPGVDLDFYWNAELPRFFDYVVETGLRAIAEHEVPDSDRILATLRQLESRRDEVLSLPVFYHQDDVHLNNLIVDGTAFSGFIDLEMCRQGNEALLLAAALTMCRHTPELWPSMRAGYEEVRGEALDNDMQSLIKTLTAFSTLIRFSWYWGTEELPQWAIDSNMRSSSARSVAGIVASTEAML